MAMNRARVRQLLSDFKFQSLFVQEMGWNSVPDGRPHHRSVIRGYVRRLIAEMSGVTVLEVFPTVPRRDAARQKYQRQDPQTDREAVTRKM